jgi:hypothetical protein
MGPRRASPLVVSVTRDISRDTFVRHEHGASLPEICLVENEALVARSGEIYERKWGKWVPHV